MNGFITGPGKKLQLPTTASYSERALFYIFNAVSNLTGAVVNGNKTGGKNLGSFVVGTTSGSPVNGSSTWTPITFSVVGLQPYLYINGALLGSAQYSVSIAGVITLTGTPTMFNTGDVIMIVY